MGTLFDIERRIHAQATKRAPSVDVLALEYQQQLLEHDISATPSGRLRNNLTAANIHLTTAITLLRNRGDIND